MNQTLLLQDRKTKHIHLFSIAEVEYDKTLRTMVLDYPHLPPSDKNTITNIVYLIEESLKTINPKKNNMIGMMNSRYHIKWFNKAIE